MITFIAFLFTIAGSINWLLIGLMQYDYIAGFFGFQAAIMSRIFYVLFGIGAVYLVLRVIINKGSFKIWERKKKKQKEDEKSLEKEEKKPSMQTQNNFQPAYANIEASKEQIPHTQNENLQQDNLHSQSVDFSKFREFQNSKNLNESENFDNSSYAQSSQSASENFFEPPQNSPSADTLFDEHIKMRK